MRLLLNNIPQELKKNRILIVVFIYLVVSTVVYRFQNPSMTETQLLLNAHNALMFKGSK